MIDPVVVTINCAGELVALVVPRSDLGALAQVAYGLGFEGPHPSRKVSRGKICKLRLVEAEWQK